MKKEFDSKNIANLEAAIEKLNNVFQAASQDMYNAANPQGAQDAGNSSDSGAETNPQDEVTDVDFEEVNEKK